ncbi:MAG: DUF6057 family protein [Alloprevotella sp.]|nr:DUF6057 family protein [Alloprevotella sp.]
MSSKKSSSPSRPAAKAAPKGAPQQPSRPAAAAPVRKWSLSAFLSKPAVVYAVTFVALWFFCQMVYGDVFARAAEANFIMADDRAMAFLTSQAWGSLYVIGRWCLLVFSAPWLGCLLLALCLTLIARLTDRLLGVGRGWLGIGSVVSGALLAYYIYLGIHLWYKSEPSLFILVTLCVVALLLVLLVLKAVARRYLVQPAAEAAETAGAATSPVSRLKALQLGILCPIVVVAAAGIAADRINQNVILTSRLQLLCQQDRWSDIIDEALTARRPSRAVACYYAIALEETDQLLQRIFDLPFDYPEERFRKQDGSEEYGLFLADANYHAGIPNIGYRCAMDHLVVNGPNIYVLKQMCICAIVNGEEALARKYLTILSHIPFQGAFVEKYSAYVGNESMIQTDATMAHVRSLKPLASHFEQNYRAPAFLGYNTGLMSGSDPSLITSIAACLYSKEIDRCLPHIQVYFQKYRMLPPVLQQVVAILGNKRPDVAAAFPQIMQAEANRIMAFVSAAKPILDERTQMQVGKSPEEQTRIKTEYNARLREALQDDWLGTYYYYYYCENNDPKQVRQAEQHGVN